MKKLKRGQEEIVGFALILIIVSVILLVFISFSLKNSSRTEMQSYEVEGFLQATLQQTSICEDYSEKLSVQRLIFSCDNGEICSDGESTCDVLNSTLQEICEKSWNIREEALIKGYELKIIKEEKEIFVISKGNSTNNYKVSMQDFSRRGQDYSMLFRAYYN